MADTLQRRTIKRRNKREGRKRFVFKRFSQRIAEVDVDVFRSLAPIKSEPSGSASFFHESLVAWRELNSAREFTSVFEELLPIVQTMPQLVLHKDRIMNSLVSRLHISAILSLEPILNLIAVLSRDLCDDFMPLLPKFLEACTELLQSGGDREPEIIEQVFTSLSYVFKYMQKLLVKDIYTVLKVTKRLRYYSHLYIQDFATEAVAYLLRNSSSKQLAKGVRKVLAEAARKPLHDCVSSCSSLLWYTLKGPGSTMHSRAEALLRLLVDRSTFEGTRKKDPGGGVIVSVLSKLFCRLREELDGKDLSLLWACLFDELESLLDEIEEGMPAGSRIIVSTDHEAKQDGDIKMGDGDLVGKVRQLHMANILCILNDVLEFRKGSRIGEFERFFGVSQRLLKFSSLASWDRDSSEISRSKMVPFQVVRFILALVKCHSCSNVVSADFALHACSWTSLWNCQGLTSLTFFIRRLLEEDTAVIQPFLPDLLRTLEFYICENPAEVLPMVMDLFYKLGVLGLTHLVQHLKGQKILSLVTSTIKDYMEELVKPLHGETPKPELLWVALCCYPYLFPLKEYDRDLAWKCACTLDQTISANKVYNWRNEEFLLATSLSCELKLANSIREINLATRVIEFLGFAIHYQHSSRILENVANFFDLYIRNLNTTINTIQLPPELHDKFDASLFESNLGSREKLMRQSSLRLLIHFESLLVGISEKVSKRRKGMDGQSYTENNLTISWIFEDLLSLETAPVNLDLGRQSNLVLTKLKAKACSGCIPEGYLIPLTHGVIGLLHNRFKLIWDGAIDALAGLLEMQKVAIWEAYIHYLESYQAIFLSEQNDLQPKEISDSLAFASDLRSRFVCSMHGKCDGSTDAGTLVSLLLQAAQKVPKVAEARTRLLIPVVVAFLSCGEDIMEESAQPKHSGKRWKVVLKEWLNLLSLMKNAKSYYLGPMVKETLIKRFLMDSDPYVQAKALECVLNWKDDYLMPYQENLKNLVSSKTSREEMTTWNIGKDAGVEISHREGLIPILLHLLFPKILKTKSRLHNKTMGGVQRKVVLAFLGQLEVQELAYFVTLLFTPLESVFAKEGLEVIDGRCAWELAVENGIQTNFIEWLDMTKISKLPYKRISGFLHMVKDILETFDDNHIEPYLKGFMAFVFKILEACQVLIDTDGSNNMHAESKIQPYLLVEDLYNGNKLVERSVMDSAGWDIDLGNESSNGASLESGLTASSNGHLSHGDISINERLPTIISEDHAGIHKTIMVSGSKALRTLAFKVLMVASKKYEDLDLSPLYWDIFLRVVRPMIFKFGAEGVSGDSPGPFLSCLLVMSRSLLLVRMLKKETELLPNIASLLSHKNATESVVMASLTLIGNIIGLQGEDKEIMTDIILSHLPVLLSNLRALLSSQQRIFSHKKPFGITRHSLRILIQLSEYVNNSSDAVQLLEVLLPLLPPPKRAVQERYVEILHIFKLLAPNLTAECIEKTLSYLGPILALVSSQDVRHAVCGFLSAISVVDSSFDLLTKTLSELNAMSTTTVGEYDYDRRSQAYAQLSTSFFCQFSYSQAILIVSQATHDVRLDDMSIRHGASGCLSLFIHFLASVYHRSLSKPTADEDTSSLVMNGMVEGNIEMRSSWGTEAVKTFIHKVLLPNMRKAMSTESLSARREWLMLLREMVINLQDIPPFNEFSPLMSTDLEVDFFYNINHIQSHRRIRAMAKFRELSDLDRFSQGTLVRLFVPLFMNSIFEGKGDTDGNLLKSAVEVLSSIAARLCWDPYYSLLMQTFRKIISHPQHERVLIRVLCSLLDNFHFHTHRGFTGGEKPDESSLSESGKILCIPEDIQLQLQKRIFPELRKLMVSKTNIINIPISVVVVKVLQLMPKEVNEIELPCIIQSIVALLKNRSQVVRDEARAGLLSVAGILGAGYVGFIVEKLRQSLRRGFEVHVLGFTLNSLIVRLFPALKVGDIDYCAVEIVDLLGNDIFEDVAEEKEVEKIAFKMKETQKTRSYESFRLLAQAVTFHAHVATLLKPVNERLKFAEIPKIRSKIERLLRQLALGIECNSLVKQDELLIFIHGLLEDGILEGMSGKDGLVESSRLVKAVPHHLMMEFALYLFESHLKRTKLHRSDHVALSMLDPMVGLLQRCLSSKHGGILMLAQRCLSYLLRLPLPSIHVVSSELLSTILLMAEKFGMKDSPIAQSCFKVLVAMMKHSESTEISEEQLRLILQLPIFVDLGMTESNTGLVLLKAIIGKKLLTPELYDMINRISDIMITSQSASVRRICSQILLQFLLDYPLGSKRLQHHLDFFIMNLSYEHATGREAVLEMLHAVIVKFPPQVIDEQSETFFLPLVTRLVNDGSAQLRAMVGTILKVLMSRVGQRSLQRMLDFCFSWLEGGKHLLWRAASQVLGLLVEVMKEKFLPNIQRVVKSSVGLLRHVLDVNIVEDSTVSWKDGYHMLMMLEKLLNQFPDICFQSNVEELWNIICSLLSHPHAWIRKVCCRLLHVYFSLCSSESTSSSKKDGQKFLLLEPNKLMVLAAAFCEIIDSVDVDDDHFTKVLQKNLIAVCIRLHSSVPNPDNKISWFDLAGKSAFMHVVKALDGLEVKSWILKERTGVDGDRQPKAVLVQQSEYHVLLPIFKCVEKILLRATDVRARVVIDWYEMISSELDVYLEPYLVSMTLPLQRIVEGTVATQISGDLKAHAENLLNHIREVVGSGKFVQAYNAVRQLTKSAREERKRAWKLKALVDPESHARRKLRLGVKRQLHKKKKMAQLKWFKN